MPSARYVDAQEASVMLDGLLGADAIRRMARAGQIPGAVLANNRVWIPRREVAGLVVDLAANPMPHKHDQRAHSRMRQVGLAS